MKRRKLISILLAGLAGVLLVVAACGSAPTAAPNGGTPLPVVVDDFAVIAEGRIVPRQFVQLSFAGGGRVDTLLAAEGASVAAEGLIAQLELKGNDALAAQVASAQFEVLNAQQ